MVSALTSCACLSPGRFCTRLEETLPSVAKFEPSAREDKGASRAFFGSWVLSRTAGKQALLDLFRLPARRYRKMLRKIKTTEWVWQAQNRAADFFRSSQKGKGRREAFLSASRQPADNYLALMVTVNALFAVLVSVPLNSAVPVTGIVPLAATLTFTITVMVCPVPMLVAEHVIVPDVPGAGPWQVLSVDVTD